MERVGGCGRRTGRDRGDSNISESSSSLVNVERQRTIASGEMYPEWGILTRPVADKSSLGNPGKRTRLNRRSCRRGADPPKNDSGTTEGVSSSNASLQIVNSVNSGNGCCIAAKASSNCEFVTSTSSI